MTISPIFLIKLLACLLIYELLKQLFLGPIIIFLSIYSLLRLDALSARNQTPPINPPETSTMSTTTPAAAADHPDEAPHFEECLCPITLDPPTTTSLPISSRIPTATDPALPGPCIYHHRLSTRDAETATFIQYSPEIDELKEVLSSGMVKFKRGGPGHGGQMVLKKATSEQLSEAADALKVLIAERDRLIRELWDKFVGRWGGRVERRDDGTMFVVDEGRHVRDLEGEGEGDGGAGGEEGKGKAKMKLQEQVEDDDADPYVKRMRAVQARMDDLELAEQRKKEKRAKAGKAADEYAN